MKKQFKLLSLFFVLALSLVLMACDNAVQLTAPVIELDGTVVSWDEVENASKYLVVVDEEEYDVSSTSYDLKDLLEGEYKIAVYALGDEDKYLKSEASNEVTLIREKITLTAPVIKLEGTVISWNEVLNATEYKVIFNEKDYLLSTTSYDLADLIKDLAVGEYKVVVHALGDSPLIEDSPASNEVLVKKAELAAPLIELTGKVVSWAKVPNAAKYLVTVNGEEYEVETTSYDLGELTELTYEISVQALSDSLFYKDSQVSNQVSLEIKDLVSLEVSEVTEAGTIYNLLIQSKEPIAGLEIEISYDEAELSITEEALIWTDLFLEDWVVQVNIVDGKIKIALTGLTYLDVKLPETLLVLGFSGIETTSTVNITSFMIDND